MTTRDVTTAELAILEELWLTGRMTIKDLAQKLYGASTPSDIATVQKLLGRLEAKNCVGRDREKWPQVFFATIAREELIGERLQATADELCEGAMGTLLTHLVQSQQLGSRERQRLRKLLDDLDEKKK
jgi:predicted transcriptional regulator